MKCPFANELGFCVRANLMPCVGVNECVLINGIHYEEFETELSRIKGITKEQILKILNKKIDFICDELLNNYGIEGKDEAVDAIHALIQGKRS